MDDNNHKTGWHSYLPVTGYLLMIVYYAPSVFSRFLTAMDNASWNSLRSFVFAFIFSLIFFGIIYLLSLKKNINYFEAPIQSNKFLSITIFLVKFILVYFAFYYLFSKFFTDKVFILIGKYYLPLLEGILNTILISILAIILGTIIGGVSAFFLASYPSRSFTKIVLNILIYVLLSIPALVLIQLIYYTGNISSLFTVSVIALSINLSPFVSKILTSSLGNIPNDQINSAKAFGFSKFDIMKKFKFPFIVKYSLQPLLVEYYTTIKLSSLVSVIGMAESFHKTQDVIKETQDPMSGYVLLSICYIILVIPIAIFADYFERKIRANH